MRLKLGVMCQIEHSPQLFKVITGAGGVFSKGRVEQYPLGGSPVENDRRDGRKGCQTGSAALVGPTQIVVKCAQIRHVPPAQFAPRHGLQHMCFTILRVSSAR